MAIAAPVMEDCASQIKFHLQNRIGSERFDLWFGEKTRMELQAGALRVAAANSFVADWIRSKFLDDVRAAARQTLSHDVAVTVSINPDIFPSAAPRTTNGNSASATLAPPAPRLPAAAASAVLNPKYILEEFVIGPSNQMAYHAAIQVAAQSDAHFNPLFIHGHCGLGKTHLLQGICRRFSQLHPAKKWLYLTGEQFTNEFLEAIKTHKTDIFRRRVRHTDLLVIDDVHFLANKKATQDEFLHCLNQIDTAGRQLVLASDCAPRQIAQMAESLVSRFVSGMVVRVDSPDLPTRLEILRRRAARNHWQLSDAVLMHVAQSAASSVRELEGLLVQVVAGMSLIKNADTQSAAQSVLQHIKDRTAMQLPVAADKIVQVAAEYFSLAPAALLGNSREKIVAQVRAVAMHLARQHTGMSFPEIGRALGNKNHSTVIAACQRVEFQLASGHVITWNSANGPQNRALADVIHDLEGSLRRGKFPAR